MVLVWLALALCLNAGPAAKPPGKSNHDRTAAAKAGKAAPQPDAAVEKAIRARFARSKIAADKFEVRVQGGVATLEGRTDVVQHKGTATRLAKTAGAASVVNRIQVSQAARDKAAANLEKGRRRAQVKRGDSRTETRANR